MRRDILIGIDAGTSVIKSLAFSTRGEQLAEASRSNSYRMLANGGVELNMRQVWDDTLATLRGLSEQIPDLARRALALSVTGQGDGTWLIDAEGAPVHDAWLWLDGRAAAEAREIAASDGIDRIYRATGTGVNVCQMRTHLTWIKRHQPELLERAATALHCKDWLYYNLTGERAADPTEGVFTFGNFRTRNYDGDVLAALGLSELAHLLPPIVDGSREASALTAAAAGSCGLPEGLPVTLGYVDIMCNAMGSGLYDFDAKPGLTILGTTGMHMRFVENAEAIALNKERSGYTMGFPGGAYAQMQTNMAATLNIDWLLDIARQVLESEGLARSRAELLAGMDQRVLAARPGAALYHPYISVAGERGPFTEPNARASLTGLDQSVGYFDLMRAVYDSLALAARDCYEAMGELPGEIRISGGAARSGALRSILAATLKVPVRAIQREESGAAGAVMIAAVQQGLYPDLAACVEEWVDPLLEAAEPPDPQLAQTYDALFEAYRATRMALAPAWTSLAQARSALQ